MSQTYTPRDPFADPVPTSEPRVSGLAIASFITSLLCCIPGVGAVAAVLGIGAVISISQSAGRLTGRSLAFLAIVLGVLGTVLYIGLFIGAAMMYGWFTPYRATFAAVEAGDYAAARQELTPAAAASATDERLQAFRDEYRQQFGNFREFPPGALGWVLGYFKIGPGMQAVEDAQKAYPSRDLVPFPATFDQGDAVVIYIIDDRQVGASGLPRVDNIGIGSGSGVVWMIDPASKPPPTP